MSGQELKEMIDTKAITFEELDNTALEKILNFETDMLCFGSGDMNTIRRCSELLNERNDSDTLNKDKIISIINKAADKHVIIVNEAKAHESKVKVIKRKNATLRRIGMVAAILIVMIVTTTLTAAALGMNVFEYIRNMVFEPEGTYISADSLTFYNAGETNNYASIEELINAEQLNIMYPLEFPENIHITSVRVNASEIGEKNIMVLTNDQNIIIDINTEVSHTDNTFGDCEKYEHNGCTYYIFKDEQLNRYSGYCIYNNNEYVISTDNYKNLLIIIKGMKE